MVLKPLFVVFRTVCIVLKSFSTTFIHLHFFRISLFQYLLQFSDMANYNKTVSYQPYRFPVSSVFFRMSQDEVNDLTKEEKQQHARHYASPQLSRGMESSNYCVIRNRDKKCQSVKERKSKEKKRLVIGLKKWCVDCNRMHLIRLGCPKQKAI